MFKNILIVLVLFYLFSKTNLYTETIYPKVYTFLFLTGNEEVIDAYSPFVNLDTDIKSTKYKWKNITKVSSSVHVLGESFFGDVKKKGSKDSFRMITFYKTKNCIVRLKTDNKTNYYIIRVHPKAVIQFINLVGTNLDKDPYEVPVSNILIYDSGGFELEYDQTDPVYTSDIEITKKYPFKDYTSDDVIYIEGGVSGIKRAKDIVIHNLDTDTDYDCNLYIDSELFPYSPDQDIKFFRCYNIPLQVGDNHFMMKAKDMAGKDVHWYLVMTRENK